MANLSTKIKMYAAANGVAEVDFMKDVMLQDDSDGKGAYIKAWNLQIEDSDSAIVRMSTNLYKNGSVISSAQMRSEGGDTVFANYTISQTRIVPAAAADYFEVYIYQESSNGSSVILEASTSHNQFFSGTKLLT